MTNLTSNSNKRIVKNTMFMYMRMLLIMVVSLFTSRVILKTLGEQDFGIYNIVGGVVVMFTFISNATISKGMPSTIIAQADNMKSMSRLKKLAYTSVSLNFFCRHSNIGSCFFYIFYYNGSCTNHASATDCQIIADTSTNSNPC